MRAIISLLFLGLITFNSAAAQTENAVPQKPSAKGSAEAIELGERHTLHSDILGEDREILIRLPAGYQQSETSVRYPVIFILDGDSHFGHASVGAGLLERYRRMPEAIIVALPNNPGTRGRDLAREKDNFSRFISEEVFTFIEANYRTSGNKTLFGHSLAGYFTLSMLADHNDMFDNYIAASPVVQVRGSELLGKFETILANDASLSKSVFFTITNAVEEGDEATGALNKLVALFKDKAPDEFKWRYDFIDAHIHMTTPYLTLYSGLSHVFADFQTPSFPSTAAYQKAGGMAALKAYFETRAAKYGRDPRVSQASIRSLAYLYSGEGKHSQAIALFTENSKNFADKPRVYNSLGDGYEAAGMLEKALASYQMAVKLAEQQNSRNAAAFKGQAARIEEKLAEE